MQSAAKSAADLYESYFATLCQLLSLCYYLIYICSFLQIKCKAAKRLDFVHKTGFLTNSYFKKSDDSNDAHREPDIV